jgi:predicted transcriptional regulator
MTTDNELTANIVAAFVSRNPVAVDAMPGLITSIYSTLSDLGTAKPEPVAAPEPAVTIKASVKPDHLVCLCCGKKAKMLKRHLMTAHGLSPQGYRDMWGLAASYQLVAANYAEKRRELAVQIWLGRKLKEPVAVEAKPSRKKAA